ncbi:MULTISPECIES: pyridoxine/pyridoxal/pyridoxamine kinase [Bacillus]|uniref:pyridoxal kinase n=2 Tax=Bacillus cereus group TaxID=86661 RepID=A0A2A7D4X6_BACAN|nr:MULTISPECIES: pyridoxine/pyridoxal/pyridoxamine kinase [Bacillus]MCP1166489.1 pyridoxine/pyridoxal/pyridoxamine kinase [Bacillus sp. 1813sda1]MDC7974351.1 pyridoxine/pyridoxal/pyridoxamine kinase [Bacillus sp. BLCC-B18]OTW69617.1 bifunctional hydroxymethylpyrimidine kinase/phosphomethylpyrimidine kinase [Bacillus thuringiensis serovar coreanensis]OTX45814.1 bifunctional hydroxymethylpyrimidine kinase/phosphomethylpyrimidine kinase [Bacillus thuringiensis serovar sooncheon]OTX48573.1 bifunct
MTLNKALTIAGSDTSGGAGIQADLKTFQELGVYGMTSLTTIVTMDPHNGWAHNVFPIPASTLKPQLETTIEGVGVDALKTGMLGSVEIIEMVAETIEKHNFKNVVVDPVMVCKGADEALHPETNDCLRDVLVPKALVVTPNLFEAYQLSGVKINSLEDMKEAAKKIHALGAKYVLIKGGSKLGTETAIDVLYDGETFDLLESEKIDTTNTHGAGCTYSAAITAELAKGKPVKEAVKTAKEFITAAIRYSFKINEYVGPTHHGAYRKFVSSKELV